MTNATQSTGTVTAAPMQTPLNQEAFNSMDKNIVIPTFGPDLARIVTITTNDDGSKTFTPNDVRCTERVSRGGSWYGSRCSFKAVTFEPKGYSGTVEAFCKVHSPARKEEKYQAKRQAERDTYDRINASRKASDEAYAKKIVACKSMKDARELVQSIMAAQRSRTQSRGWW